jgi:hypothetical protein
MSLGRLYELLRQWAADEGRYLLEFRPKLCQLVKDGNALEVVDRWGIVYEVDLDDLGCCGSTRWRGLLQAVVQDAISDRGWRFRLEGDSEKAVAQVFPNAIARGTLRALGPRTAHGEPLEALLDAYHQAVVASASA